MARACAVLAVATAPGTGIAQEEAPPPIELLEYLGSWQDDDEEWFVDAELDPPPGADVGEKRKRADDEQE